ncbi:hypothetical protein CAOG_005559 [Capsaspora owczarzaki ATCC 30864]|uniref:Inositol polyphosphate-related phosphatase domain-containing protein n=1 Tax=Capsaspora owczarzaki (strain ATCC 30864) TaxID=595528 RepID=A0A0D2X3X4_CAPO3|nr:hypothetical protein CAOG_005559 [Capsaspora owczarzaki ATCC 30864]
MQSKQNADSAAEQVAIVTTGSLPRSTPSHHGPVRSSPIQTPQIPVSGGEQSASGSSSLPHSTAGLSSSSASSAESTALSRRLAPLQPHASLSLDPSGPTSTALITPNGVGNAGPGSPAQPAAFKFIGAQGYRPASRSEYLLRCWCIKRNMSIKTLLGIWFFGTFLLAVILNTALFARNSGDIVDKVLSLGFTILFLGIQFGFICWFVMTLTRPLRAFEQDMRNMTKLLEAMNADEPAPPLSAQPKPSVGQPAAEPASPLPVDHASIAVPGSPANDLEAGSAALAENAASSSRVSELTQVFEAQSQLLTMASRTHERNHRLRTDLTMAYDTVSQLMQRLQQRERQLAAAQRELLDFELIVSQMAAADEAAHGATDDNVSVYDDDDQQSLASFAEAEVEDNPAPPSAAPRLEVPAPPSRARRPSSVSLSGGDIERLKYQVEHSRQQGIFADTAFEANRLVLPRTSLPLSPPPRVLPPPAAHSGIDQVLAAVGSAPAVISVTPATPHDPAPPPNPLPTVQPVEGALIAPPPMHPSSNTTPRLVSLSSQLHRRIEPLLGLSLRSVSKPFTISIGTWNVGNAAPVGTLLPWVDPGADLVAIGVQECAYSAPEGSSCESHFHSLLLDALGSQFSTVTVCNILAAAGMRAPNTKAFYDTAGIRLFVFARRAIVRYISSVQTDAVRTGLAKVGFNKGAVGASLRLFDLSICFVNAHFAAHQEKIRERNQDFGRIISKMNLGESDADFSNAFHAVFWMGDLNYRIERSRDAVLSTISTVQQDQQRVAAEAAATHLASFEAQSQLANEASGLPANPWRDLLSVDQLNLNRAAGCVFAGFDEMPISFAPTFKLDPGASTYESVKKRVPSWCDRVLYKTLPGVSVLPVSYESVPTMRSSDHRPVQAKFTIDIPLPRPVSVQRMFPARLVLTNVIVTQVPNPPAYVTWSEGVDSGHAHHHAAAGVDTAAGPSSPAKPASAHRIPTEPVLAAGLAGTLAPAMNAAAAAAVIASPSVHSEGSGVVVSLDDTKAETSARGALLTFLPKFGKKRKPSDDHDDAPGDADDDAMHLGEIAMDSEQLGTDADNSLLFASSFMQTVVWSQWHRQSLTLDLWETELQELGTLHVKIFLRRKLDQSASYSDLSALDERRKATHRLGEGALGLRSVVDALLASSPLTPATKSVRPSDGDAPTKQVNRETPFDVPLFQNGRLVAHVRGMAKLSRRSNRRTAVR